MRFRSLLLPLLLGSFAASAAKAQMSVAMPGRAPGFAVKVMSWSEIPFRTIVRQRFDFSCGSAAVATLLTYQYGVPTDEATPFKAMFDRGDQVKIRKSGFSLLDMRNYLQSRGLPAQGYSLELADLHALARPMIALVTIGGYKHFVVVKGAREGRVLIGDPARGLMAVPDADFAKIWSGIALIVMDPPGTVHTTFNLTKDWNPWSTSPLRTVQGERTINSVTDALPPIYQLEVPLLPYVIPVGGIK